MVNNGEYAGFHKWWYPKNEWFIVENPKQKWVINGVPPF